MKLRETGSGQKVCVCLFVRLHLQNAHKENDWAYFDHPYSSIINCGLLQESVWEVSTVDSSILGNNSPKNSNMGSEIGIPA